MPRPRRFTPRDSSRRRLWIYLAVIAFVLVDLILISWALGARTTGSTATVTGPIPTFTPDSTAAPSPTADATSTVAIPPTRILSALDGTTAWRATTGECPSAGATPEVTTDAGGTWLETNATAEVEITALQRLTVVSESQIELVGLNAGDCAPQFARSFVAGEDYSNAPNLLGDQWYIDPADRAVVHTPRGLVAAPCASVVDLAPRPDDDGAAAITCSDMNVFSTTEFGETWSVPLKGDGIVNVAVTAVGYLIATVGLPECAGVQLIALSVNATTATPTGCLPVDEPAETMQGNVAVSVVAGTLWVWVGDSVMRSIDQGTSWQ